MFFERRDPELMVVRNALDEVVYPLQRFKGGGDPVESFAKRIELGADFDADDIAAAIPRGLQAGIRKTSARGSSNPAITALTRTSPDSRVSSVGRL